MVNERKKKTYRSSWQNKNKTSKIYALEWITFDDLLRESNSSQAHRPVEWKHTQETTIKESRLDFMAIYCCYHTLSLLFYDNN